jgi:phospholipase C
MRVAPILSVLLSLAVSGCGGGAAGPPPVSNLPPPPPAKKGKHFTHIVIIVQENRTFDNLFATYPGADGTTVGKTHDGTMRLREAKLESSISPGNGYAHWIRDYNHGRMNGFDLDPIGRTPGTYVYQYVNPAQIGPYWDLAKHYVLSDHTFQTEGSGSFTAHQDLIAGGTTLEKSKKETDVDYPSHMPWGCDAPAGTKTSLLVPDGSDFKVELTGGPFPCFKYATLRDLLDAKSISWKYYSPPEPYGTGELWDAFDAIHAVRDGPEWKTKVTHQPTVFFSDVANGTLPQLAWIVPDDVNSDHPGPASDTGPSWVASIVNAIGESKYWPDTAIVVVWDDWGGFYDHVPPPFFDEWGGLGFRVPMLVVSAYARKGPLSQGGYVSHTHYEFGSILKFVENVWQLGSLGTTDARAKSIGDAFDFAKKPRTFQQIPSKYSRAYFERQPPSYLPVDSE